MSLKNFRAEDFKGASAKPKAAKKAAAPAPQVSDPSEPPTGTVEEVLDWVGDDDARAEAALEAEEATDKPRKTLVEALENQLTAGDEE